MPYDLTTATDPPTLHPEPYRHPPMMPSEIPPGVEMVTLPGGYRTLAYTQPPAPTAPAQSVSQPIPRWAKTTALLTPTIGGGLAAGGVGLSYAAPGLIAMSQVMWSAVALIATSVPAVVALLWAARRHTGGQASTAQITQHVTATGLFGRANGTINQ